MTDTKRFLGIVAVAVLVAVATFQDRIALALGALVVSVTIIFGVVALMSAGLAFFRSTRGLTVHRDLDDELVAPAEQRRL